MQENLITIDPQKHSNGGAAIPQRMELHVSQRDSGPPQWFADLTFNLYDRSGERVGQLNLREEYHPRETVIDIHNRAETRLLTLLKDFVVSATAAQQKKANEKE